MRTSNHILFLFFSCSLLISINSCRKIDLVDSNTTNRSKVLEKLKGTMIEKQNSLSGYNKSIIDTLLSQAKWEKGQIVTASDGKQLVFVPTINTRIGLEFFYDGTTEVVDSINIIKVFANRFFDDPNPIKAILTYYESVVLKKQSFDKYTGTIQTFSW